MSDCSATSQSLWARQRSVNAASACASSGCSASADSYASARSGDVAGLEENAPAAHLDGEPLLGIGHALHAALEQLRRARAASCARRRCARADRTRLRTRRRSRPRLRARASARSSSFASSCQILPGRRTRPASCRSPTTLLRASDSLASAAPRAVAGVLARLDEELPRDDVARVFDRWRARGACAPRRRFRAASRPRRRARATSRSRTDATRARRGAW